MGVICSIDMTAYSCCLSAGFCCWGLCLMEGSAPSSHCADDPAVS